VQIATVIQRILTGYAVSYSRKHRRPELVGGGRIRMVGGWDTVKKLLKTGFCPKGAERVMADTEFDVTFS
jgi:hypothetical protein